MVFKKLKKIFKKNKNNIADIEYVINDIPLSLPHNHPLPIFQKHYSLYDRYLPFLMSALNTGNHLIIDVGANCADTLAIIAKSAPNSHYICIEPDDIFFKYLEINRKKIQNTYPNIQIDTLKIFIGDTTKKVSLVTNTHAGTRSTIETESQDGIYMQSLDNVLSNYKKPIACIKIDVDGFDYDVLFSADTILTTQNPVIYFECDPRNPDQLKQYQNLLPFLHNKKYSNWVLFDNFGSPITTTDDINVVSNVIDYVYWSQFRKTSVTFCYCDILVCKPPQQESVNQSLVDYKNYMMSL